MLALIDRFEQQIAQDDLTIDLLHAIKDMVHKQESMVKEQQFIFFGLCALVFVILVFLIFTIKYWRK